MKNLKIKTLLLFALCGGLVACKKREKEEVVSFPIDLTYSNLTIKNSVRLFSDGKEIKDSKVINDFLGTDKNLFTTEYKLTNMGNLRFISTDTLETLYPPELEADFTLKRKLFFQLHIPYWEVPFYYPSAERNSHFNKFSIAKSNDQFIFYSSEPIDIFNYNNFGNLLPKHKSPVVSIPSPLPLPIPDDKKYTKRVMLGYGTYNEIAINYMICKFSVQIKYPYFPRRYASISLNSNEFDENIISTLGATDTLAVTTYSIHYKKM